MPDQNNPELEPKQKRQFIREKIARPPMTKRQLMGRMAALSLIAVLGGTAAGASFAVVGPLADRFLDPETTEERIPITIPKDDPDFPTAESQPEKDSTAGTESQGESQAPGESESESAAETELQTETETEPESETEPLEDVIQSVIETYEYTLKDLDALYGTLRDVVFEADRGIVEVHSVKNLKTEGKEADS